MYEYRPCLYFDVALFHSWLQGITSKSVKKSENSPLNPGDCEWPSRGVLFVPICRRSAFVLPPFLQPDMRSGLLHLIFPTSTKARCDHPL